MEKSKLIRDLLFCFERRKAKWAEAGSGGLHTASAGDKILSQQSPHFPAVL